MKEMHIMKGLIFSNQVFPCLKHYRQYFVQIEVVGVGVVVVVNLMLLVQQVTQSL